MLPFLPRLLPLALVLASLPVLSLAGQVEGAREATRVLEEELKLSARPQLYLVLDLTERVIVIKGRGIGLYRLQVADWHASDERPLDKTFTLRARPTIIRPRVVPGRDPTLDPIDLRHMPVDYDLLFDPGLTVMVTPPPSERPWLWLKTLLRGWWERSRAWGGAPSSTESRPGAVYVRLVLSQEAAQSLAWSVTDGMPLIIRRADKPLPFAGP